MTLNLSLHVWAPAFYLSDQVPPSADIYWTISSMLGCFECQIKQPWKKKNIRLFSRKTTHFFFNPFRVHFNSHHYPVIYWKYHKMKRWKNEADFSQWKWMNYLIDHHVILTSLQSLPQLCREAVKMRENMSLKNKCRPFLQCVIKAGSSDRLPTEAAFILNNNSSITELITALFSLSWASLLRIIHSGWQVPSPA